MMNMYWPGNSLLHRLPTRIKLLGLVVIAATVFIYLNFFFVTGLLLLGISFYWVCHLPKLAFWQMLKTSFWLQVMLFSLHWYLESLHTAFVICLRLYVLLVFASLFSLTTRLSETIESLEKLFSFLRLFKVSPRKVSLGIALAIRFIPLIIEVSHHVREAQTVRGNDRHIIALVIPILIQTLKMADTLAQAIEARGYE